MHRLLRASTHPVDPWIGHRFGQFSVPDRASGRVARRERSSSDTQHAHRARVFGAGAPDARRGSATETDFPARELVLVDVQVPTVKDTGREPDCVRFPTPRQWGRPTHSVSNLRASPDQRTACSRRQWQRPRRNADAPQDSSARSGDCVDRRRSECAAHHPGANRAAIAVEPVSCRTRQRPWTR